MKYTERELVATICQSLENTPEAWRFDEHYASTIDGAVALWTANGLLSLSAQNPKLGFSLLGKIKLWKAIKNAKIRLTISAIHATHGARSSP